MRLLPLAVLFATVFYCRVWWMLELMAGLTVFLGRVIRWVCMSSINARVGQVRAVEKWDAGGTDPGFLAEKIDPTASLG
ncbi:hypothetical protein B0H67DRAFT_217926 [Lasiosphaeris hirsuta]|uniref:Uncharacterized protein n=1 Tax=Lasiosphaeris hirsuta TaxID=260670 RepID=A0AA40DVF2_9PEZI|nr:hypothetical protein B0H67DRAFT_217926 [Lasiosphaeris hirsuta]